MSAYRKMLLNLLGNRCELCDSTKNLEIHHKDGNKINNDVRNIQLLCRKCHRIKMHSKEKDTKGKNVELSFTDEQWITLEKFRGVFGNRDSEIIKYIVMNYLSEKDYITKEIKSKFYSQT